MLETKGHHLTIGLSASELLDSLLIASIIDPFLDIAWFSHSLFFFLLPSLLSSLPPNMYQVLCKFASWKQLQKSV